MKLSERRKKALEILAKPHTREQLQEILCCSKTPAAECLRDLKKAGLIYIESFDGNRPLFKVGNLPDAVSKRRPSTETSRESRRRRKADQVEHELHLARRRALRIKPQRDPLAFWIPTRSTREDQANG